MKNVVQTLEKWARFLHLVNKLHAFLKWYSVTALKHVRDSKVLAGADRVSLQNKYFLNEGILVFCIDTWDLLQKNK